MFDAIVIFNSIHVDNYQEIGSSSTSGAGSPIMGEAVKRISSAFSGGKSTEDCLSTSIQKSFVLSVDQAHAVHPNYANKHEQGHSPKMNQGMVIKRNSNQRYATNAVTGLIMKEIARRNGLPKVQEFVVRNDCGCGSTIGPIISSSTGIRAIDMGCPQLSMHSIRETMGVADCKSFNVNIVFISYILIDSSCYIQLLTCSIVTNGLNLFKAFFKDFRDVDSSLEQ